MLQLFASKNSIDEKVEEILKNDKLYIDKVVDGIPIWRNNGDLFKYSMEDSFLIHFV